MKCNFVNITINFRSSLISFFYGCVGSLATRIYVALFCALCEPRMDRFYERGVPFD